MISEGPSARPDRRGGRVVPWALTRLAPLVVLALAAVLVGGCLARDDLSVRHARHAAASVSARPLPSGSVNTTDLAWLQLMIAMDQRVLPLLDVGESRGHAPAVRRLAQKLHDAHVTELARLRATLDAIGLPAEDPHAGHDMPGMVTAAELARLRTAEGPVFDPLFTGHLTAHLRQSLSVTRSERLSGADPSVKAMAAAIERTRMTQLSLVERSPF